MTERTLTQVVNEQLSKEGRKAERTLTQVTKEIEQAAKRVSDAKLTVAAAQEELKSLLGERNEIETELLAGTGFAPSRLESTRDEVPLVTRRTRSDSGKPRSIPTQTAANGASAEEVKQWLVDSGHRKDKRGTISEGQMKLYNDAHPV